MKYPAAPCRRNTPPGHTRRARAVGAAPGACWRVPEAGRSRSQVSASASQARKSSTGTPPDRQHPDCRHIAVGTLVSQRPPHRSGRARQGIRLLPSVRRPSELSPHKRRLAHRRGREASCDTLTWRSVQYVLRIPFLPLAPVLPSTDSAEVATPLCSPASTVL